MSSVTPALSKALNHETNARSDAFSTEIKCPMAFSVFLWGQYGVFLNK